MVMARDGAAAARGGLRDHGPHGGQEGLDHGHGLAGRQRGQASTHVPAVAGGGLGDDLRLAAGEVMVDRAARGPAVLQDIGE